MGLRVWSGGEIFGKKIKTLWGAHKAPPIKSKVKKSNLLTLMLKEKGKVNEKNIK